MNQSDNSVRELPAPGGSGFHYRRVIDAMPVELLRDQRGVYGIGVAQGGGIVEALAGACGAEHAEATRVPQPLILRPDRLEHLPRRRSGAALQKITQQHAVFQHTTEEVLRQIIHHEAVERALPPKGGPDDKARKAEYQRKYHGLRLLSVSLVNRLIGQLIQEAADRDAIRAARRFTLCCRENIYGAAAQDRRILQLTETFPLAALATCTDWMLSDVLAPLWNRTEVSLVDLRETAATAAQLVKRGARLRDVAATLGIPMALRRVKPGVAHLVSAFLIENPDTLRWMPNETPAARIWLELVAYASRHDADFARWVARHVSEIPGRLPQVSNTIRDLLDWVHANAEGGGQQFVTRCFNPSMALRTAIRASHHWHEAVASHMDAGDLALPPPWYPPATLGGFDIVPLTTSADLYREGHAMHHCVATYVEQVRQGTSYIFSVRRDGKRIATISLSCHNETILIQQLRGPCNTAPPKAVSAAVRKWLRAQRPTAAAIRQRHEEWSCATQMTRRQTWARAAPDNFDDIQF